MTDDIIERLRGPAALLTIEEGTKLLGEAAAEIKRLRAEIEDLKSANTLLHNLVINRDTEIDRLRTKTSELAELILRQGLRVNSQEMQIARLEIEVAQWRDRYECERVDHEADMGDLHMQQGKPRP